METLTKVIVFKMNDQQYSVNIEQVRSIERIQEITEIPRTSAFIKGVISLREDIIPIVDLKERLGLGKTVNTSETRILIVTLDMVQVGLIVDSATDVIDINSTTIDPAPKIIESISTDYLTGVAKVANELLLILNIEALFSHEEINEVEEVIEQ